ncbi:LacI family DNA-binding transcriptional regulator [Nocardioides sp. KR10-350]|uniref:LacI family DNA-binding transcriptional regulator n=1 Tax=Nocardioides cheoyonin TaxID=3156615 RepID=UPI0032B35B86
MSTTKVTLGHVAREAGVSISTASEALSGRGRMTAATRQSVRDAAERLGYRPNALARSLRTGRTHAIALHHLDAANSFDTEYFREFVAGVMDVTRTHDYDLTLLSSDPDRRRPVAPQVDGIIIADPIADDLRAVELLSAGLPVVAGERYPPGMPDSPVIGIGHEQALIELLDHAYDVGVRRPMLFTPDDNSGWGIVLRDAFLAWCHDHELEGLHRVTRFVSARTIQYPALEEAVAGPDPVDLVIMSGEHAALAAIDWLRDHDLVVGRDILLAATADARLLQRAEPPVTAIDLSPRDLGSACAQALIRHLDEGTELAPLTLLPPKLFLRESTAALTRRRRPPE